MTVVAQEPWDHTVEERGTDLVAVLLCGSSAMWTREVVLTADDARRVRTDPASSRAVVAAIRADAARGGEGAR